MAQVHGSPPWPWVWPWPLSREEGKPAAMEKRGGGANGQRERGQWPKKERERGEIFFAP
jgi:hypothetical protein